MIKVIKSETINIIPQYLWLVVVGIWFQVVKYIFCRNIDLSQTRLFQIHTIMIKVIKSETINIISQYLGLVVVGIWFQVVKYRFCRHAGLSQTYLRFSYSHTLWSYFYLNHMSRSSLFLSLGKPQTS